MESIFQTTSASQQPRLVSMTAGSAIVAGALLLAVIGPLFVIAGPKAPFPPPPPVFVKLVPAPKPHRKPPPPRDGGGKTKEAGRSRPAHVAVRILRPGTASWKSHVEHGRDLSFDIYADRSLPVLRAYGVTLALDSVRPRGVTTLFSLATRNYTRGPVPRDVVIRELQDLPPAPDLEAALRRAQAEAGTQLRVFALYPYELYWALRSLTEEALHDASVPVQSVARATVRLELIGGKNFAVSLVNHL